jgi:predicted regulator of Ras-like GTPase activity (Roadblock/LC7/MglB family)
MTRQSGRGPVAPALRATALAQAQALLDETPGVSAVVVATEDGFDLAAAARAGVDPGRVAALASSIAAIGQVVSEEAGLGASRCVTVETERGHVLVHSARRPDVDLAITVLASSDALLGMVKLRAAAVAQALVRA